MSLKLRTKTIAVWVKVNEELKCEQVDEDYKLGENEAMVYAEVLPPKEMYNLIDSSRETEWEKNQRFDKGPNWYKLKIQKIKKSFKDWKGFLDQDGNAIACDDKNKEVLFNLNKDLFDAVLDFLDALQEKKATEVQDELKNLNNGQTGSSKTE